MKRYLAGGLAAVFLAICARRLAVRAGGPQPDAVRAARHARRTDRGPQAPREDLQQLPRRILKRPAARLVPRLPQGCRQGHQGFDRLSWTLRRGRAESPAKPAIPTTPGGRQIIVVLDQKTFPHDLTDFVLKGKHQKIACKDCHAAKAKFRDAPSDCIACHRKDDKHKGGLGAKCESCHVETDWKTVASFDHSKTRFPLNGAHQKTACQQCHAGEKYRGVPMTCIGCHQKQDVHKGSLGKKCESCHNETDWKKATAFDHSKTRFPLNGAHQKTACQKCHARGQVPRCPGDMHRLPSKAGRPQGQPRQEMRRAATTSLTGRRSIPSTTRRPAFRSRAPTARPSAPAATRRVSARSSISPASPATRRTTSTRDRSGSAANPVTTPRAGKTRWRSTTARRGFRCAGCMSTSPARTVTSRRPTRTLRRIAPPATPTAIHKGRLGPRCEQCHSAKGWPFFHFDHDADTQFRVDRCAPEGRLPRVPQGASGQGAEAADDLRRLSCGGRRPSWQFRQPLREVPFDQVVQGDERFAVKSSRPTEGA